jgi:hypothetical protein
MQPSPGSPFVRDVMLRVERGPIGNPPVGPNRVGWENSQEEEYRTYVQAVGLTNDLRAQLCPSDLKPGGQRCCIGWIATLVRAPTHGSWAD